MADLSAPNSAGNLKNVKKVEMETKALKNLKFCKCIVPLARAPKSTPNEQEYRVYSISSKSTRVQ